MADFVRKFKDFIGMGDIEEDGYYEDEPSTPVALETKAKEENDARDSLFSRSYQPENSAPIEKHVFKKPSRLERGEDKVVNFNSAGGLRVVLSKPTEYDNCETICSHLRAQMTIVLNLEYVTNPNDRRRIFDFVSGCAYALDGTIQKITEYVYIMAPYNVDVFKELEENEKAAASKEDFSASFI
ncbi:MAG: cell division protein SepF [Clostridiales bacterium]|nr:cell division protein SepF [Clostridiales bacterium]